jgi:sigma-B regulation protein RsbU (phosphoserine phosphatase)
MLARGDDLLEDAGRGAFDRITELGARRFGVAASVIAVVEDGWIRFGAGAGPAAGESNREAGAWVPILLRDRAWALGDGGVAAPPGPLLAGEAELRFGAGAPLTADGVTLGALCILDRRPRQLPDADRRDLEAMAAIVVEVLELRRRARERFEGEHLQRLRAEAVTATLRESLLPAKLPEVPGVDLASYFAPASSLEVGGDFYDCFMVEPDRWLLAIADVTGKGAGAAAAAALVRYAVRTAASEGQSPSQMAGTANRAVYFGRRDIGDRFATLLLVELALAEGEFNLRVTRAGHPPLLVAKAGRTPDQLTAPGPMLGLNPDQRYTSGSSRFGPGDVIALYTDGLTDARTEGGFLGTEGVAAALLENASGSAAAIAEAIASRAHSGRVTDDIALLVAKIPTGGGR